MKLTRKAGGIITVFLLITLFLPSLSFKEDPNNCFSLNNMALAAQASTEKEPFAVEQEVVADPLEGLNRVFFRFNDKLYFWFLKPVSKVYAAFIPEGVRIGIRNAYHNILFPVRVVNNTFQGKVSQAGGELSRFVLNSTIGFVGMVDVAGRDFGLPSHDEDLGQTLGYYGMKPIIYLNWPLLGPSSLRDTIGSVGDVALNPIFWATLDEPLAGAGVRVGTTVNNTSLLIGEYEDLKKSALDPYIAVRDAYLQNRAKEVKK